MEQSAHSSNKATLLIDGNKKSLETKVDVDHKNDNGGGSSSGPTSNSTGRTNPTSSDALPPSGQSSATDNLSESSNDATPAAVSRPTLTETILKWLHGLKNGHEPTNDAALAETDLRSELAEIIRTWPYSTKSDLEPSNGETLAAVKEVKSSLINIFMNKRVCLSRDITNALAPCIGDSDSLNGLPPYGLPPNKNQLCKLYHVDPNANKCQENSNCLFAHGADELRYAVNVKHSKPNEPACYYRCQMWIDSKCRHSKGRSIPCCVSMCSKHPPPNEEKPFYSCLSVNSSCHRNQTMACCLYVEFKPGIKYNLSNGKCRS